MEGGRATQQCLHLLLLLALVPTEPVNALPLRNMVMTHQNIVMTLHGLMDHIDGAELQQNQASALERMTKFYKEGAPGLKNVTSKNGVDAAHGITTMWAWLDADGDGTFCSHVCLYGRACVCENIPTKF